jgi:NAD(P)-dependent dehydrogenase (short-subunit alcohol dehydrogenase family)
VRQNYTRGVSLRSFIEPEDIADTAMFLASKNASKITGQFISVDGHLESIGGV